jgi:XTP/dITP diphosphohydrolase
MTAALARKAPFAKLVLASRNKGKIEELSQLLAPYGVELTSALALDLPEVPETTNTFDGNAAQKAEAVAQMTGLPALADDSGLCVDALDGAPGVDSAYYGPPTKLVEALTGNPTRGAHFICVLALKVPGQPVRFFHGRVDGTISPECRGTGGHGFDPVFVPVGHTATFAEMPAAQKNALSHRGKALQLFLSQMFG